MKAVEVFVPGGLPTVTLIDSHIREKRQQLLDTLETGSLVVVLSGPSKSGKTVFVEDAVGKGNMIHVTGAGVDQPSVLWTRIFAIVGTDLAKSATKTKGGASSLGGKVEAGVGIPLVGVKGETNTAVSSTHSESLTSEAAIDYQAVLVKEFKDSGLLLFIDDFHYIAKGAQKVVAETVKEIVRQGVRVILAATPYRADDSLRANADLRGRSMTIDFGYWEPATLLQIAQRGFPELKVHVTDQFCAALVAEAAGSPQLMQALCLQACFEAGVRETLPVEAALSTDPTIFKRTCLRAVGLTDFRTIYEKMKEGPKTRGTDRRQYTTSNGAEGDVYTIVLAALALDPPQLTTRYTPLLSRIQKLCPVESPSGSSVIGACDHMAAIGNGIAGIPLIEWDSENDVFDIRDPYFLFYLRWSAFPEHV